MINEELADQRTTEQKHSVTGEGFQILGEWLRAAELVDRERARMDAAYRDLREAEKALITWMLPPVIKPQPGEKLAIWFGDSLIQVEVGGVVSTTEGSEVGCVSSTRVTIRYRGHEFHKLK